MNLPESVRELFEEDPVPEDASAAEAGAETDTATEPETASKGPPRIKDDTRAPAESIDDADDGNSPVAEVEDRVDELEAEVNSATEKLDAIESSQDRLADQLDEIDGSMRQLLGIYGEVTDDVNPFTEPDSGGEEEEGRFGVLSHDHDTDGDASGDSAAPEGTVSFEDLKQQYTDPSSASDGNRSDGTPGGGSASGDPGGEAAGDAEALLEAHPADAQETETAAASDPSREEQDEPDAGGAGPSGGSVVRAPDDETLTDLRATYATDLLVYEWLSHLVTKTGPAATLKALEYYRQIGWIAPDVKRDIESRLGGPELDIDIDPTQPRDLTATDHARSYTYIRKLDALRRIEVPAR